jgi:hypothetical protein
MKHLLPVLILMAGFAANSWADSGSPEPTDPPAAAQVQSDHATGTDTNSAASPYPHGTPRANNRELNDSVSNAVLDAITQAMENNPNLSDTDKENITEKLQDKRRMGGWIGWRDWGDGDMGRRNFGIGKTLIAALSILLIFGTPIMLVAAVLYAGHRKRRLARDMASEFLANGQPVPAEVWQGLAGGTSSRSNLHKGMIMLGAGVGIFVCFWLIGSMKAAYLGLIPLFIGIAQLLIWKLEKPQEINSEK